MRKVTMLLCGALLTACAQGLSSLPGGSGSGAGDREQPLAPNNYKLVYSFKDGEDGGYPVDGLANVNGVLYGTTYGGGGGLEWGTVFKIESGQERVLYRFKAGNDGAHPYAGLTEFNGSLYGTTTQGGTSGAGTVFKISPSGVEQVLYSFKGGTDGEYPCARLYPLNGTFYGTTEEGGAPSGWGTVFSVTPSGTEKVLYRFLAGKDGAHPYAGLIDVGGTLYGTTYQGGTHGAGTVFTISTSGAERVLYSFKGGMDGVYPYASLLDLGSALYGTTYQGGVSTGWGTVFKVTTSGQERVIYRFKANDNNTHDGAHPWYGSLIAHDNALFGTTYEGGQDGGGTVFEVGLNGVERVLYSFRGDPDGLYPYGGLNDVSGTLYGTTYEGGTSNAGAVFKIAP